jgi:histidine phosphotransferase ChpT
MSAPITKLTPTSLSALLCARICHDLISPVGALGTAIEILDDESNVDMHDDALALVRTSSRQASAKLKFLRLAFGAAGSAPGVIPTAEITKLSNDMFADAKPDLVWNIDSDGIDKDRARILMNLIMLAVQAAPRGGKVTISRHGQGEGANFVLVSEGPKVRLDAAVAKALAGKAPDDGFDGRSIQPLYASLLTRDIGGAIAASADDTGEDTIITFKADFPANAT